MTRTRDGQRHTYSAAPRLLLLLDAVERMLADLPATPAERRQLAELLDAERL